MNFSLSIIDVHKQRVVVHCDLFKIKSGCFTLKTLIMYHIRPSSKKEVVINICISMMSTFPFTQLFIFVFVSYNGSASYADISIVDSIFRVKAETDDVILLLS